MLGLTSGAYSWGLGGLSKGLVQEVAEAWAGPLLLVAVGLGRWKGVAVEAIMAAAAIKANQLEVQ